MYYLRHSGSAWFARYENVILAVTAQHSEQLRNWSRSQILLIIAAGIRRIKTGIELYRANSWLTERTL